MAASSRSELVTKCRKTLYAIIHKHLAAIVAHPHHYVTALALTLMLVASGRADTPSVLCAWFYAVAENIVSGREI